MLSAVAGTDFTIPPAPAAHFGAGAIGKLPRLVRDTGREAAVIVTDATLAGTAVIAAVTGVLRADGIPAAVFDGVHANPTTDDLAAGADAVSAAGPGSAAIVAVGGGSSLDAAKGIALAAVNPQRGRDLDYRHDFANEAVPIVAVPTTAGTGAETNAFGVVTDTGSRRKFYVGHASSMSAAAILDPDLTVGLPPAVTAATGMDALTHAVESYLSVRANPWSDGIALQVIRMIAANLPRAWADGSDPEARGQMLLAAHMAGVGMATTGLGACHAIGHALGGRYGIAHGVALCLVLPQVLRFNRPACEGRLADVAAALGVGEAGAGPRRATDPAVEADAAVEAIATLSASLGMPGRLGEFGIGPDDFDRIAADALDDEVIANAPRRPAAADIIAMLTEAGSC
jgi:alcohol dehydrogenase